MGMMKRRAAIAAAWIVGVPAVFVAGEVAGWIGAHWMNQSYDTGRGFYWGCVVIAIAWWVKSQPTVTGLGGYSPGMISPRRSRPSAYYKEMQRKATERWPHLDDDE